MGQNREKSKEIEKNNPIACEIILQIMTAAADFFPLECIYLYPVQSVSMIYAFLLDSHTITRANVLSILALRAISKIMLPFPHGLSMLASHRRKNAHRC